MSICQERRAAEERRRIRDKDRVRESRVTASERDAYCMALKSLFMQMESKVTTMVTASTHPHECQQNAVHSSEMCWHGVKPQR